MHCQLLSRLIELLFLGSSILQLPPLPDEQPQEKQRNPQPRVFVAQRSIDLGPVVDGEKRDVTWLVENRGTEDLVIEKIRSSCGCTVVELGDTERIVHPGETLKIDATFDSTGRSGPQVKNVTVFSNDRLEPELQLELRAQVTALYVVNPPGIVNLRALRKGETAVQTVEFSPGPGRRSMEILAVDPYEGTPIRCKTLRVPDGSGDRYQLTFAVPPDTALGLLSSQLKVKLRVDDHEREKIVVVRGEVVGPLDWHPRIIDLTQQKVTREKRLIPLTIRSTELVPFEILGISAGPLFDVAVDAVDGVPARTQYKCTLQVRPDAPPGPFAAALDVVCSELDQPLIRVPVFGVISPPIEVNPPMVLLRQDGSKEGSRRLVKLETSRQLEFEILALKCDFPAVTATPNTELNSTLEYVRYLDVGLNGALEQGVHRTVLIVETTLDEAGSIEIPVTIQVP